MKYRLVIWTPDKAPYICHTDPRFDHVANAGATWAEVRTQDIVMVEEVA